MQIARASNAAGKARAHGVGVAAIGSRVDLPLDAFERKGGRDDLLARQRPNRRYRTASGAFVAGAEAGALTLDHLAVCQRTEAQSQHLDPTALGAQKIDVAITGDCHEAARQRNIAQRQLVYALKRSGGRIARDEGTGGPDTKPECFQRTRTCARYCRSPGIRPRPAGRAL